jgi:Xaa-Pro dipeptidase
MRKTAAMSIMSDPAKFDSRNPLDATRRDMAQQGIDLLVAFHDGAHFIEKPNAVMVLSGFKSIGEAMVILPREGKATLAVMPAWDVDRAAEKARDFNAVGVDPILDALADWLTRRAVPAAKIATVGLTGMPWHIGERMKQIVRGETRGMGKIVFGNARCKMAEQIANARRAAQIAEHGYQRLRQIARPGMREDDLAVELRHSMKTMGAEDNFLMLCAGAHNRAVQPSSGRRLEAGDIILAEITPSYMGQMAQICRTAVLGPANESLQRGYELVLRSMEQGIAAALPGATMADVCRAIDSLLEAGGYGEFCHPPHIRRRGHGLGFGSNLPGDVSLDNPTSLEAGMLFVIHPNQYLPETGYLLCGEPVLITESAPEVLSQGRASLDEIRF